MGPCDITAFSLLGGRASVVDLHLQSLKEYMPDVKKICLLPDQSRDKTLKVSDKYKKNFTFIERETFGFLKKYPDGNYDKLLKNYCATNNFLFLHDDSIIHSNLGGTLINLLEEFDFVGAIDNAVRPDDYNHYSKIIWDGSPMSEIRIGTWFLCGNYKTYSKHKLSVGAGGYLYPLLSNLKYWTTKLNVKGVRVHVDGGFNFNIKARLLDFRIKILEAEKLGYATHFSRVTAGFANRKLIEYIDTDEEVGIWQNRFGEFGRKEVQAQALKDLNFLYGLCSFYEDYGIKDDLINKNTIDGLKNLYNSHAKEFI